MGKLNLDVLQEEKQQYDFCVNKVKSMRTNEDQNFMLDDNNILRKVVKLRYTIEPTIVVPSKLTLFVIVEFHSGKGHQTISCTMNMMRCYFWWVSMHRCTPTHP